jgi:hypothetical protein
MRWREIDRNGKTARRDRGEQVPLDGTALVRLEPKIVSLIAKSALTKS